MDLFIVRHAWAGQRGDPRWPDDDLRPLSSEGKKRFALLVEMLAGRGFAPELIVTSPLVRCLETAGLIARGVPECPEVIPRDELRPGGDLESLLRWTVGQSRHCRRMAWVGHAPDVGRLTSALIGDGNAWIRFAKGAVALVRFPGQPNAGDGELRWLVTARLLGI